MILPCRRCCRGKDGRALVQLLRRNDPQQSPFVLLSVVFFNSTYVRAAALLQYNSWFYTLAIEAPLLLAMPSLLSPPFGVCCCPVFGVMGDYDSIYLTCV